MLNFNNTRLTKRVEGLMERGLGSSWCVRRGMPTLKHRSMSNWLPSSMAQPLDAWTARNPRKWSSLRKRAGRRGLAAGPVNKLN